MKTYTIREISERFHLPASTLRYYEEVGLLENVARTESKQRIYTDEHIKRLDGIECFKRTGLSITGIQEFYKYESTLSENTQNIDNILALVTKHESHIIDQIAVLQQELLHIQHKVRYYNGVKKAIEANEKWPEWDEFT